MARRTLAAREMRANMTIGELYGKVLADDGLKKSLAEAAKAGKVAGGGYITWLKSASYVMHGYANSSEC